MMEVVIIEDERLMADYMAKTLRKLQLDLNVTAVVHSVQEGIVYFQHNPLPDLVISDIQLGDGLSFEIFATIPDAVPVIFCTAYDEYALEAFQANGIDYLLKPFTAGSLKKALQKYLTLTQGPPQPSQLSYEAVMQLFAQREEQSPTSILVHHKDQILPIRIADIALIFLDGGVCHLLTKEGRLYFVLKSLEELAKIVGKQFFRVNRQFLVQRSVIVAASNDLSRRLSLVLTVPYKDPVLVSKDRVPQFLEWLSVS